MIPGDDITQAEHEYWERQVEAQKEKTWACSPYTPEQVQEAVEDAFLQYHKNVGDFWSSEVAIMEADVEDFVIDVLHRLKGER